MLWSGVVKTKAVPTISKVHIVHLADNSFARGYSERAKSPVYDVDENSPAFGVDPFS
jgi:hypothetical protein